MRAPLIPLALGLGALCCAPKVTDWGTFDVLRQSAPRPRAQLGDRPIDAATYRSARRLGERWFRESTFGNERTITDVLGLFGGSVEVPCGAGEGRACRCSEPVLPLFAKAVDALDGAPGNLFTGNGGGYTSDLVLVFPPGATRHGVPVPERLHTGLDVEAGSPWPIGIVPIAAPPAEAALPYLIEPAALGVGPAPAGKVRLGLTCATCHFSLDIDWDGKADLRSAWSDQPTPGSPYRPEHAWAVGNQDLRLGWVIALSENPLAVFSVFSGVIGGTEAKHARAFARRVKASYRNAPDLVLAEVVRGMAVQPRGFADDTPDGLFNAMQIPSLYTRRNFPYNYDGNFVNAEDRNNGVWSIALDPTALVSLTRDRAGAASELLPGQKGIYNEFSAAELAELMVFRSPAARHDPAMRARLRDDILGLTDGVPGLLEPASVLLVPGLPHAVPSSIRDHPQNVAARRDRSAASFGGDARLRPAVLGYSGTRVRTPPAVRADREVSTWIRRYGVNADELLSESVSLMLDSLDPPPNRSPLLAGARSLVARGYEIFRQSGCAGCHQGPFFTDNLVHPLKKIRTQPARAEFGKLLQRFLAPSYDARTGKATAGGPFDFTGARRVGYKTVTLRYVWGSAPYLHDGGVGVAPRPGSPPAASLKQLLSRDPAENVYGTGPILAERELHPEGAFRANAAQSLQALVLEAERERVIRGNREAVLPVPGTAWRLRGSDFAIEGIGHEYFVADVPGGDDVTALVAFLLSLDDAPGEP